MGKSGGKWGMKLSGEFNVLLDEKFRITLPVQLRKEMDVTSVKVTKGNDNCLWLYTLEKWKELFEDTFKDITNPFSKKNRRALRKYIAPSQTLEIDKAGRILIPDNLRTYAGVLKDCVVVGLMDYVEIWDADRYRAYCDEDNEDNANEFDEASEELSQIIKKRKGIDN
jgi:MraZ protein